MCLICSFCDWGLISIIIIMSPVSSSLHLFMQNYYFNYVLLDSRRDYHTCMLSCSFFSFAIHTYTHTIYESWSIITLKCCFFLCWIVRFRNGYNKRMHPREYNFTHYASICVLNAESDKLTVYMLVINMK